MTLCLARFDAALSRSHAISSCLGAAARLHERNYDTYGRIVRYRLGNTVRDLGYDAADRISTYTHYDALTAAAAAGLDQSFTYDELSRLTGISTSAASWSIAYDANGNRTALTLNGSTRNHTVSACSNRLDALSNPLRSLAYDSAGNTTGDSGAPSLAYTAIYDAAGRLATITQGSVTTTYAYDAQGRRVRKYASAGGTGAAGSTVVLFAYDQAGQLLGEYTADGTPLREYVWLGATPVAVFMPDAASAAPASSPPQVFYVHTDHLGTPRVVTDTEGNLRWRWLAEPFGTTAAESNPQGLGSFTLPLRMPGQYADAESGLFYNYFRDYDGSTGRYVQSDPIGLAGGINTYVYVGGNALAFTDDDGLNPRAIQMSFQFGYRVGQEINPYIQPYITRMLDAVMADPMQMARPRTPAQQAEYDREYEAYKDLEDHPPPKGPNCDDLKRRLDYWRKVEQMRIDFADKWFRGRYDWGHLYRIFIARAQIKRLEKRIKDMCKDECP